MNQLTTEKRIGVVAALVEGVVFYPAGLEGLIALQIVRLRCPMPT